MKLILSLLILSSFLPREVSATNSKDTVPVNHSAGDQLYYKTKAKKQMTAGTVIFVTGAVMATTGLGLALSGLNHLFEQNAPPPKDYGSWPEILGYGGLVLIGLSIAMFFLAKRNKKKAKSFSGPTATVYRQPMLKKINQFNAGVVFHFGKHHKSSFK